MWRYQKIQPFELTHPLWLWNTHIPVKYYSYCNVQYPIFNIYHMRILIFLFFITMYLFCNHLFYFSGVFRGSIFMTLNNLTVHLYDYNKSILFYSFLFKKKTFSLLVNNMMPQQMVHSYRHLIFYIIYFTKLKCMSSSFPKNHLDVRVEV